MRHGAHHAVPAESMSTPKLERIGRPRVAPVYFLEPPGAFGWGVYVNDSFWAAESFVDAMEFAHTVAGRTIRRVGVRVT